MQPGITALVQPVSSVDQRLCLLNELQSAIGAKSFQHWFQGRTTIEIAPEAVRVRVGSQFQLTWMQRRFGADLIQSAKTTLGDRPVQWEVDPLVGSQSREALTSDVLPIGVLPFGTVVTQAGSAPVERTGSTSAGTESRLSVVSKAATNREARGRRVASRIARSP